VSLSWIVNSAAVSAVAHAVLTEPLAGAAAGPVPQRGAGGLGRAVGAAAGAVGSVVDQQVVLAAGGHQLVLTLLPQVGLLLKIHTLLNTLVRCNFSKELSCHGCVLCAIQYIMYNTVSLGL
jgi:hypothetical protein